MGLEPGFGGLRDCALRQRCRVAIVAEAVRRVVQLFSDVYFGCPVDECDGGWPRMSNVGQDVLDDMANHMIGKHGWLVLHVGQETTTDNEGKPWQRTTIVLGQPGT